MAPVNWVKAVWNKLFRDSETLFWGFIQALSGAAMFFWDNQELRNALVNFASPEYAGLALVVLGGVTVLARISRARDL